MQIVIVFVVAAGDATDAVRSSGDIRASRTETKNKLRSGDLPQVLIEQVVEENATDRSVA